jgi:DNA repair protein SbcD/Mre11
MKILHTADIHLREHEDKRWHALEQVIETGKKEKAGLCIISGDLFNKGVDAEKLRPKIRNLFSGNGFKILVIPGNHDKDSFRSGLFFGEDTIILNKNSNLFENNEVRVAGLPFQSIEGQQLLDRLAGFKPVFTADKPNILVCHGELLDSFFSRRDLGDEGNERYMPFWLWYFHQLNVDYVLAGHFHSRFDVRRLENQGYFVYPGSPVSITRKETGKRKINLFELGGEPREYPIDSYHFEAVDVSIEPFSGANPFSLIGEKIKDLHPEARILLKVRGFFDGKILNMNETSLLEKIKDLVGDQLEDLTFEISDIQNILSSSLFRDFKAKVEGEETDPETKKALLDYAIQAMIGTETCG